jgi:hypothetical protein
VQRRTRQLHVKHTQQRCPERIDELGAEALVTRRAEWEVAQVDFKLMHVQKN